MLQSLLIAVRFHEGRYHGVDDGFAESEGWPPSPARLFQALVAGASKGAKLDSEDVKALGWLQELEPPRIVAPAARHGRSVKLYVPNNDLDAKGGDPARLNEIRVAKNWRPCFFDVREPVLYAWDFEEGIADATQICAIAERIYQLGRAIDMAWAEGTVLRQEEANQALSTHPGTLRVPKGHGSVAVPHSGTLESLILRHQRKRERLRTVGEGRKTRQLFSQPPRASFGTIAYDAPPSRLLFELRSSSGAFVPHALDSVATLLSGIREVAADRLSKAFPEESEKYQLLIVGRDAGPADLKQRIRLIPIPSIGTEHTDRAIRRIMLEIPVDCSIRKDDLKWAFAGIQGVEMETGEALPGVLVSTEDSRMADRFMSRGQCFRSVTPLALPRPGGRRSRNPAKISSKMRADQEKHYSSALVQALRHVGVEVRPTKIVVQKEPFHRRGVRADRFAAGSRFPAQALWHAEVHFPEPITGPLILGNGRFLGLGLFEVISQDHDVIVFNLDRALPELVESDRTLITMHLRRALMSLARNESGGVYPLFSGHEPGGAHAQSGRHQHVFLAVDAPNGKRQFNRLIVATPWACDRTESASKSRSELFQRVVNRLEQLRAGRLGVFGDLKAVPVDDEDPLVSPARDWTGSTPYLATRNLKKHEEPVQMLQDDVVTECIRRGLPKPEKVEVSKVSAGPKGGRPSARIDLRFRVAVRGPIILGRNSHYGGGLFHASG